MKVSEQYLEKREEYQKEVLAIRDQLPRHWVKMITDKRKNLSRQAYNKLYNDLVNLMNGRSYRLYRTRKDLLREIIELTNHKS